MKLIIETIGMWNMFFLLNTFLAWWNVDIVHKNQKAGIKAQINHPACGFLYSGICMTQYPLFHDWYFIGSIALLHLSVFPVAYNRDSGLPAFNLSKTSKAITDRLQVWIGLKTSAAVNITAFLISIALLIKSFF